MKRFAVLSDVHGNSEALRAVLADITRKKISDVYFAGDAVGYGPDPDECVDLLCARCSILVAGNHDWGVLGLTDLEYFNPYAREAIEWTREHIKSDSESKLKRLPLAKEMRDKNLYLVHATPKEPEKWHYLLSLWDAEVNFHHFETQICIVGHSHQPFIIERLPSGEMVTHRQKVTIGKTERYIVNAGSVGQPRDGDPRACYVVVDHKTITTYRIPYEVAKTQEKMGSHGLPSMLIERLSRGV